MALEMILPYRNIKVKFGEICLIGAEDKVKKCDFLST